MRSMPARVSAILEAWLSRRVNVVRVPQIGWIRMVRRTLRRAGLLAVSVRERPVLAEITA
jgi:hypothetical protein